jgi:hypothetical protein
MKFRGNFGELVIQINGSKATGKYQETGEVEGEFLDNKFTGVWRNKGLEGLVEFTVSSDLLNGTWKKGLEPGNMRGKWWGELITERSPDEDAESASPVTLEYHPYFTQVLNTPTNNTACALASLIRHFMVVDRKVSEDELNWMQASFDHYDGLSIPVRDVWDHVDETMLEIESLGLTGKILSLSTSILKHQLNEEEKNKFLLILQEIVASDDIVTHEEFDGLSYVVEQFYPGGTDTLISNFKKSGIEVK